MPQHTADHHQMTTATTEMILISDAVAAGGQRRAALLLRRSVRRADAAVGRPEPGDLLDLRPRAADDGRARCRPASATCRSTRPTTASSSSCGPAARRPSCWPTPPTSPTFIDRTLELVPLGAEMDHYDLDLGPALDAGARLVRGVTDSHPLRSRRPERAQAVDRLRQPAVPARRRANRPGPSRGWAAITARRRRNATGESALTCCRFGCSAPRSDTVAGPRSPDGDVRQADVAQLVAHHLAKVRVAGSNPVVRSEEVQAVTWVASAVGWPRGEATACKAVYTGSNPVPTSQDGRSVSPIGMVKGD